MLWRLQVVLLWLLLSAVYADDNHGRSLAFVFDTTGSMEDELKQAIAGAKKILAEALRNPERNWKDFILVPFKDPEIGPVTVTTDAEEFQNKLESIRVSDGGDCPEMSVGAILEALKLALSHSYLYVFTDASAKDYNLSDQVISTVQEKHSKVVFVMTGLCSNRNDADFIVYDKIATASSGQVLEVEKSEVDKVLDAVLEVTIKGPEKGEEINILSLDKSSATANKGDKAVIEIDDASSEIIASLSGKDLEMTFTNPEGHQLTSSEVLTVLDLPNVLIKKVKSPSPGTWIVIYVSSSSHSLRIKGTSTISFDQRFATRDIDVQFNSSLLRPYSGVPVFMLIEVEGLEAGEKLTHVELLTVNGSVLMTLPLHHGDLDYQLYLSEATIFPDRLFIIQVIGVDKLGFLIKRVSKSAMSPASTEGIDDCELGIDNCHRHANCTATVDGFNCDCKAGWRGSGVMCYSEITDDTTSDAVVNHSYGPLTVTVLLLALAL